MAPEEDLHSEAYARFHEWSSLHYQADVPFYAEVVDRYGDPVLDVACATGRLAIPLARQGHEVVGLVCSRPMLELVRKRVREEPPAARQRLSFLQEEPEEMDLDRRFGAVLMPNSAVFRLHGKYSIQQCFRRLYRHTRPGGAAVLDCIAPEQMAEQEIGRRVEVEESVNPRTGLLNRELRRVTNIMWDTQLVNVELTYVEVEDGEERRHTFERTCRWLEKDEGVEMLRHAGFPEVDVYGDFNRSPYTEESPRLVLVARRLERDFI
ncbi:MAG: class I SAM-dependent methyltransferase [Planctomycetota bacterium]